MISSRLSSFEFFILCGFALLFIFQAYFSIVGRQIDTTRTEKQIINPLCVSDLRSGVKPIQTKGQMFSIATHIIGEHGINQQVIILQHTVILFSNKKSKFTMQPHKYGINTIQYHQLNRHIPNSEKVGCLASSC